MGHEVMALGLVRGCSFEDCRTRCTNGLRIVSHAVLVETPCRRRGPGNNGDSSILGHATGAVVVLSRRGAETGGWCTQSLGGVDA
jgi:hypothetical protein